MRVRKRSHLKGSAPNAEQFEVLQHVAARITREWFEERDDSAPVSTEEPLFRLLHGLPGTGKSKVIAWIRELFESILGWQHGVQFVCLAFQNMMAGNIDGLTIHTWGGIPFQDVTDAYRSNPEEINELYVRCQSMRWILIDEISMVSAELLEELQKRVTQATSHHALYKRRPDGSYRPFGGKNCLVLGDNEQLPPVKATALFDRPSAGNTLLASDGLRRFWSRDRDSLQGVWELTEPMRCSDPWYQAFLAEVRRGALCQDNYFFIHGEPTSVVGSMIPGEQAPRCGNNLCVELQEHEWPTRFLQGANAAESS